MSEPPFAAIVVGAGAVGLAAALGLARGDLRVCLVGPPPAARDGRTAALLDGSLRLLRRLGLGQDLERASAQLRTMRIVDDTGSLFRPPPVEFRADEIGLPAFGRNVENADLVDLLAAAVARESRIVWDRQLAGGLGPEGSAIVRLADGREVESRLVVAADGRASPMRAAAGIRARAHRYPQMALTTIIRHARPHGGASTEFHTRSGPFTLVPLPGDRSSVVLVERPSIAKRLSATPDTELAREIGRRSGSLLGESAIDGPRGLVPLGRLTVDRLSAGRVVLIGEAAHALPPIGAQGLNLGLADVAALADVVLEARAAGRDIGGADTLRSYGRARTADVRVRTLAVDGLNRSLLSDLLPLDAARGLGLGALARIGPLRRAVMRAGLT